MKLQLKHNTHNETTPASPQLGVINTNARAFPALSAATRSVCNFVNAAPRVVCTKGGLH
jgi:hypothetical protein